PNMVKEGQTLKITPKKAQETGKTSAPGQTELQRLDDVKKEDTKKPESNPVKSQQFVKVQAGASKQVTGGSTSQNKEVTGQKQGQDVKKTDKPGEQKQGQETQQKKEEVKYDPSGDVKVLNKAMDGWGTDEDAILNVLKGKSPEQRKALKEAYKQKYGKDLESEVKSEMSGGDWDKAKALLDSGKIGDTDKLRQAMAGAGTDEGAIIRSLEGKSPEEIANMKTEYKQRYGKDLTEDLKSELSGTDLKKTELLMKGEPQPDMNIKDPEARKADLVKRKGDFIADRVSIDMEAVKTGGSEERRVLLDSLYGKSPEERKAYQEAYKNKTGRELESDLRNNLQGTDRDIAMEYLKNGKESDAAKLHRAMDGLGTDEKSIFRTLEGKTEDERKALVKEYKDKYGVDLMKDLEGDLSGSDMAKAKNLMDKGKIDTAGKLDIAMSGAGTDEKGIFEALEKASPEERAKMSKDKALLERLDGELSGEDKARAMALLNSKDGKLSTTDKLDVAMAGGGTDEKGIYEALEKATPEERKAIMNDPKMMEKLKGELNDEEMGRVNTIFKDGKLPANTKLADAMGGAGTDEEGVFSALQGATEDERKALMKDEKFMRNLREELSGTDLEKAELLLKQGKLSTEQKLDLSMKGAGTDENSVFSAIKDASPEERKKLLGDKAFMDRLEGEMSGSDLERAKILLEKGKTTSVEDLHLAIQGAGTDEDAIMKTLGECKDDKEKQALIKEYREKYGTDLLSDLKGDLSTSDYNKTYDMLQKKPETLEERKEQLEDKLTRQRDGGTFWTGVSNGIMDSFGDEGRNLDDAAREVRQTQREIAKGGTVDEASLKKLDRAEQRVESSIEAYQEAKDNVAEGISTVASVAAATVVTIGTAGAGASVAVPWLIGSTLTCAGMKVGINKAIQGDNYDAFGTDGLKDFATGAVEGATNVLTPVAAAKLTGGIGSKTVQEVAKVAIDDGLYAASNKAFETSIDDKTWKDGFGEGLKKVTTETVAGGIIGGTVGAGTDLLMKGAGSQMEKILKKEVIEGTSEVIEGGSKVAAKKAANKGIKKAEEHVVIDGIKTGALIEPKVTTGEVIHDGVIGQEEENK
ncbi:MAG: hypothetical protein ABRQ38_18350, partial [Candidatus Eremiobacterota bacterium]